MWNHTTRQRSVATTELFSDELLVMHLIFHFLLENFSCSPTVLNLGINEESVRATIAVFAVSAFDIHWNLCMICTMYYYLQSENNKPEIM